MTTYRTDSDYLVQKNCHRLIVSRSELQNRDFECLVFNWAKIEPGQAIPEECFEYIDEHSLKGLYQAFLDKAWSMGLRPAHYQDDDKELKATRYHLEDMRCMAFGKEPNESPQGHDRTRNKGW